MAYIKGQASMAGGRGYLQKSKDMLIVPDVYYMKYVIKNLILIIKAKAIAKAEVSVYVSYEN